MNIRRFFRFSLRTLLILSFLVGSVWLLLPKRPAWRMEYAMDVSTASSTGRTYTSAHGTKLWEKEGRHFVFYKNGRVHFEFDFNETINDSQNARNKDFSTFWQHSIAQCFSPDLTKLLVADGCHARLYDLDSKRMLHEWMLVESDKDVLPDTFAAPSLAFSPDGSTLAVVSISTDRSYVLDAAHGGIVKEIDAHFRYVSHVQLSRDNTSLLVIDSSVPTIFDVESGVGRIVKMNGELTIDASKSRLIEGEKITLAVYDTVKGVLVFNPETREAKDVWNDSAYRFQEFSDDGLGASLPISAALPMRRKKNIAGSTSF